VTGIDLPDYSLARLRADVVSASQGLSGKGRVLTLACAHGAAGNNAVGRVVLPCVAMAPPSLVDFIISRGLSDGVAIAGCAERDCFNRSGVAWTQARFDRKRDPYLRERVPRERILMVWAGPTEETRLQSEITSFAEKLAAMSTFDKMRPMELAEVTEIFGRTCSEDQA
jgi:coenzyme F420-reducing hydrogenase delta subunit